jgi:hypothetical protein
MNSVCIFFSPTYLLLRRGPRLSDGKLLRLRLRALVDGDVLAAMIR